MNRAAANGIELAYETFGRASGRPLLLIMGLAAQMVAWPDRLCEMLAEKGHYVIRFDNRDIGLSTRMDQLPLPNLMELITRMQNGQEVCPPYALTDMAGDAAGLMDALGLSRAHVCGFSMGGMIAQLLALEHPERVLSLTSMASSTSEPDLPQATPAAINVLLSQVPRDREAFIRYNTRVFEVLAGGSPHFDPRVQDGISAATFDRGIYPPGFIRQFTAIMTARGRREALKSLSLPALVIHGPEDPLLPFAHGEDTARAIPGAAFKPLPGLGHGLAVPALWEEIVAAITSHTAA